MAGRWLNRTVFGIGLASLLSDWAHEIATAVLPAFLATMGAAAAWLGLIEGVSDAISSFAKMGSGYFTDQMRRRKPIAVFGYVLTAVGTACFGLATQAWHVLVCRAAAWFGRGVRTPVRKALLAAAVTPATYGRAFGFERMMDTCGAIIGPVTATGLLVAFQHNYSHVFFATVIPGLLAAAAIAFLVREKKRAPVPHVSFGARLAALPKNYRRFLLAVGLFGAGDFAHTMLILLATQRLTPVYGAGKAATIAVSLYVLHNVLYAGFAFVAGWLADRYDKRALLAGGYALAALVGLILVFAPMNLPVLVVVFALAGIFVAAEEALEDSLAAELVDPEHHGMGFGVLATVNGVGDFLSSLVVGVLWTAFGTSVAFAYSTVLFVAGAVVLSRLAAERNESVEHGNAP
ncbi:MAG: MFS transporter [Verrucomicrobiae bacterium]|nr:MFS transporter [Verrucomicrobiae bacterium]